VHSVPVALLVGVALTTGGCGTMAGDCSGGTFDGAGGCIPNDHGPAVAQQAAFRHFGDSADAVACFNNGPLRYRGRRLHQYACKAIRGGHLQNDETYCVITGQDGPIPDGQTAAILAARPLQRQRCGG
jgi:hypothetical protein